MAVSCSKAAFCLYLPRDQPHWHWCSEAFQLVLAEVVQRKKMSHQLSCDRAYYDLSGRAQLLQSGSEIWRLSRHCFGVTPGFTDQISDDDLSRRYAHSGCHVGFIAKLQLCNGVGRFQS